MSWTYDPKKFASAAPGWYTGATEGVRYQVRFLMQDTKDARQLMQDEEIDWLQTQEMNAYTMAARCCDELVTRAGGVQSKRIGDLSITYDVKFYAGLAASLRARGETYQTPYMGGISIADKLSQLADADAVQPFAFRSAFDNPEASQPSPNGESINPLLQGPGV